MQSEVGTVKNLLQVQQQQLPEQGVSKKGVRWSEGGEGGDEEEWRRLPGKSRDMAERIDQAGESGGRSEEGGGQALATTTSSTALASLPPKSPREFELETTVGSWSSNVNRCYAWMDGMNG